MKRKIIFCIAFLLYFNISFGQVPQPGDYITNSNIDKFVGTWKWSTGNEEVTIQLKKVKFLNNSPAYFDDVLFGSHTYIKNGVIVESSMSDFPLLGPAKKGSIYLWNIPEEGANKVVGNLWDISKSKDVKLTLEFLPGTTPTLQWKLNTYDGLVIQPTPEGLTLPRNILLVKQ